MAKKYETTLTCDRDQDGTKSDVTIAFGLEGDHYEIDLCEEHAQEFSQAMAPFTSFARQVPSGPVRQHKKRDVKSRRRTREIREWAVAEGIELSPRGRLPAHVITRYRERGK